MGLVNRIQDARTEQEILSLIAEGQTYSMVSPKTQRRWRYVAKRCIQALRKEPAKKEDVIPSAEDQEEQSEKKKKYTRKYRRK